MRPEKQKAEEIFKLAIQTEDRAERRAFVDGKCSNDSKLRAEVESLLKAFEATGDFLEAPISDPDVTLDSTSQEEPGSARDRVCGHS